MHLIDDDGVVHNVAKHQVSKTWGYTECKRIYTVREEMTVIANSFMAETKEQVSCLFCLTREAR